MKVNTVPVWKGISNQLAALPVQNWAVLPESSKLRQAAHASDTLLVPDQLLPVSVQRLIVLVPAGGIDEYALARRVWQLAAGSGLEVLYLALSHDAEQVSTQCRRLINLAALTTYPQVRVDTNVHTDKNWSQALRRTLQPGDLLVCLAEDSTTGFFRRQPLAKRLAADLSVPIYLLGDLLVKPATPSRYWIREIAAWLVSIALIVSFYLIQVGIDQSYARPQSTILLVLSILVELYSLWKTNEWIG